MSNSSKNNYINNADFLNALVDHKAKVAESISEGKPKPKTPNYIGECFMKIAENLAKRPNFYAYTFKDEMISDAIENMILYYDNFNPNKSSNPFAYFTQISWYAFVRRIAKEKKQQYIKYKSAENFGALDEAELLELGNGEVKQIEVYQNMYEFIEKYELENKKKTAEKNKGLELFIDESIIEDVIEVVHTIEDEETNE
jgi:hypothetical protein